MTNESAKDNLRLVGVQCWTASISATGETNINVSGTYSHITGMPDLENKLLLGHY